MNEGWFGGVIVEFHPDVTAAEANEFLAAICRAMMAREQLVVGASYQGPTAEGNRKPSWATEVGASA